MDLDVLRSEPVRPLRRVEFVKLVESGAFEDERVELLHGVLVEMPRQSGPHAGLTAWVHNQLTLLLQGRADLRSHSSFAASEFSMPEPDVQVIPLGLKFATPETAFLLVEVSDSSLRRDRSIKTGIYAAAGVPEYWIVDVQGRAVERYTQPLEDRYTHVERVERGEITLVAFPDVALSIDELFS